MKYRNIMFILLLTVYSCLDPNVGNIDISDINLTPEFAFPVGSEEIPFSYYKDFIPYFNHPILDTVNLSDSIFLFDSVFIQLPDSINVDVDQKFSFSNYTDSLDVIEKIQIRTNVKNGIPGTIYTQVYYMSGTSASATIIDSLYTNGPIKIRKPKLDSEGNLLTNNIITYDSSFDGPERIKRILKTDFLRIHTYLKISSYSEFQAKFAEKQTLWVQVSAIVSFNVDLNEL